MSQEENGNYGESTAENVGTFSQIVLLSGDWTLNQIDDGKNVTETKKYHPLRGYLSPQSKEPIINDFKDPLAGGISALFSNQTLKIMPSS